MLQKILRYRREGLLVGVLGALGVAYVSQYVFGLTPCILCIYQRVPYAVMAGIIVTMLLLGRGLSRRWLYLLLLASLVEVGIASYHVGVEQGLITQTVGCADEMNADVTLEELKAQLFAKPNVPCDKPQFLFLGLSMAAWNILYALVLSMLIIFYIKHVDTEG